MAALRRHLITEPRFQIGFTFAFVRGVLLTVAIPALVAFLTIQMISKNPSLTDANRVVLSRATDHLVVVFALASALLGSISAFVGLLLSHRYAGPLKRVESWAARQLLGEPTEDLVLRPGDELMGMASTIVRIMKKGTTS